MSSPRQRRNAIQEACLECQESHRLLICGRCLRHVHICSHCDRGQIYCRECAGIQQREREHRAGKKYQGTLKGASKHADRQAKYRMSLLEKVTHRGYPDSPPDPKDEAKQALITSEETVEVSTNLQDQGVPELRSEGSKPIDEEPIPATTSTPEDALAFPTPRRGVYREYRCDFCGRRCGVYSRLGFIRRR